ncbi:Elf1-domain-containing protein [Tothia fuscella]|uniref:Transcription elongation factor 1 homolog n=1 Tax=Tothia fuscella TaxID=1048955 RepID=A0A9P4NIU6_9PEZI|nr:Elf1-domain-containing protein [Tothia fuscella]
MGKRKKAAKKPTGKKKNEPLPTTFQCLFCNHEKSVTVKMEKKQGIGFLNCKVCGQHFNSGINYLSAAVDVYSDWVDACDDVAKRAAADGGGEPTGGYARRQSGGAPREPASDDEGAPGEMDDFVEEDEMDAEAEYT